MPGTIFFSAFETPELGTTFSLTQQNCSKKPAVLLPDA